MKIIAINGSHTGKRGYTHFLIEKLFKGATAAGADCEEITLAKLKINICKGCAVCNTEKHLLKCIYEEKDDVAMIFNKMREADIIIYATPIYVFTMSGLMKVFIDRINSTGNSGDFKLSESGLFFHHISAARQRIVLCFPATTLERLLSTPPASASERDYRLPPPFQIPVAFFVCSDKLIQVTVRGSLEVFIMNTNELSVRQTAIRLRLAGERIGSIGHTLHKSEAWFHKWWRRYLEKGPDGLYELTRANHQVANRTPAPIEQAVLGIRRRLWLLIRLLTPATA